MISSQKTDKASDASEARGEARTGSMGYADEAHGADEKRGIGRMDEGLGAGRAGRAGGAVEGLDADEARGEAHVGHAGQTTRMASEAPAGRAGQADRADGAAPTGSAGGSRDFLSLNFVLLFLAHFIVVSVYFLFITTMARHAMQAFACSNSTAGFVASIFLVGAAFARVFAGRFSDALGLKRCSLAALALMLASCLLYPVADTSLPLMFAIRLLHGISFGIANTTMPALAAEIIPIEVMAEGTGWFMLSNSLGVGIGPLFGLLVSGSFEYGTLYWICSLLALVAVAATLPLSAGTRPRSQVGTALKALPKFKISLVFDPATRRFSFYMFLVAFAYSSINSFMDAYSASIGLEGWAAGVFLVYSVVLILLRPPAGRLQDRKGENAVLYPSIASMALGTLVCALCSEFPVPALLLLVGVFAATGFGTCMSSGLAVVSRLSQGGSAAPGIATFYLLCDFGCGLGPFLLGFISNSFGYVGMYLACSVVALAAVAYYHVFHGRHQAQS